jgi:hypothetical protein
MASLCLVKIEKTCSLVAATYSSVATLPSCLSTDPETHMNKQNLGKDQMQWL